jgi:hypothetical protein
VCPAFRAVKARFVTKAGQAENGADVGAKSDLMGQNFQSCLEQDAQEHQRAMDDLMRDAQ